jgi:hypothetical protein
MNTNIISNYLRESITKPNKLLINKILNQQAQEKQFVIVKRAETLNSIAPANFTERILRNNLTCAYLCFLRYTGVILHGLAIITVNSTDVYSSQSSKNLPQRRNQRRFFENYWYEI